MRNTKPAQQIRPQDGSLYRFLLGNGLARTRLQATIILLAVSLFFVFWTALLWINRYYDYQSRQVFVEDIPASKRAQIPPEILDALPSRHD